MGERAMLPHDRGHLLWTSEDGASRMLTSSMDRWTTAIVGDDGIDGPVMGFGEKVTAHVTSRADGTIAGAAAVDYMLQIWAPSLSTSWKAGDGRRVSEGDVVVEISGDSESILRMERSILNLLGQLSGIATNAAQWATIAPRQVAATRKTVWGMLDKWAVHLGGGLTHRLNKDDATMIKENDLAVSGDSGMQAIVQLLSTMDVANCGAFLELEVTNEKDAIVAASTWKQRQESESLRQLDLMLDNFGPERSKIWLANSQIWDCAMQSFSKQVETSYLMIWKNGGNAVSMFSQPVPSIEELLLSISACSSTNEVDPWIMLPTRPIRVIVRC